MKRGFGAWCRISFFLLAGTTALLLVVLSLWSVVASFRYQDSWTSTCAAARQDSNVRRAIEIAYLGAFAAYREMMDEPSATPAFVQDDAEKALDQLLSEGLKKRWRPIVVGRGFTWWEYFLGYFGFRTFSTDGVITLWGKTESFPRSIAVVAVEGTNPFETPDLIRDLTTGSVRADLRTLTPCIDRGDHCVEVHAGFLRYAGYASTRIMLVELTTEPDALLVVTGHSLGGAAAILLGAHLVQKYPAFAGRTVIVTFGAPGVTSNFDALAIQLKGITVMNFRHHQDPIPSMASLMGLELPGVQLRTKCPGCLVFSPPILPSAHSLVTYGDTVSACLRE